MGSQVTRHASLAIALVLAAALAGCSSGDDASPAGGSAGVSGTPDAGPAGSSAGDNGGDNREGDASSAADGGASGSAMPELDAEPEVVEPCGNVRELCCGTTPSCEVGLTCSDQFCLTCGAPPAPREGCRNVATTAMASAQQTFPGNPLAALNDDDVCVAWGSGDYPDIEGAAASGTWIQLDLQEPTTLDAMSFWVKQTPAEADVTLAFAYSIDGETWTGWPGDAVVTKRLSDNAPWVEDFAPAITARYFKVTFVKSLSFVSMRELALYACTPP